MKTSTFISKRYAVLLCYLLILVADSDVDQLNLEKIYSLWKRANPSRSTFANLITDLSDLGWIEKKPGVKRSSFELKIHKSIIRDALQLKPNVNLRQTWAYSEDIFDFERIGYRASAATSQPSRMAKRWTLQEELNKFLYPD